MRSDSSAVMPLCCLVVFADLAAWFGRVCSCLIAYVLLRAARDFNGKVTETTGTLMVRYVSDLGPRRNRCRRLEFCGGRFRALWPRGWRREVSARILQQSLVRVRSFPRRLSAVLRLGV